MAEGVLSDTFAPDALTQDAFLGGKLRIWQPKSGYRAGIDPVLLAASVAARASQSVLELGCGAGVASLCLARRVPGLHLFGAELQTAYAQVARRNAAENGIEMTVFTADLRHLPPALRERSFDHVIANPPYFIGDQRSCARDDGRETALAGATPLVDWIDAAARRLAPKGWLSVIMDAARLPDLLGVCDGRFGSLSLFPLAPRHGRAARLVILRARKGGRALFRLNAPLILHHGAHHDGDRESYAPHLRAVLRDGAPLFDEN